MKLSEIFGLRIKSLKKLPPASLILSPLFKVSRIRELPFWRLQSKVLGKEIGGKDTVGSRLKTNDTSLTADNSISHEPTRWYFWPVHQYLGVERCLTTENNEQVNRGRPVLTLHVHLHRNDAEVSVLSGARQSGAERLTGTVCSRDEEEGGVRSKDGKSDFAVG